MKFLDDLEIFFAYGVSLGRGTLAEISFTTIADEENNGSCHEAWIILFAPRMRKEKIRDQLPEVLIHELEHYYVAKILLSWKIPARQSRTLERDQKRVYLDFSPYPEWTHSEPSYGPERETTIV
jgi:hypothetical protein